MNNSIFRFIFSIGIIVLICYCLMPGEKKPFWYNNSQVGWELANAKKPVGYDEVSEFIINKIGISYVKWKRDEILCNVWSGTLRFEWVGDKLLLRYVDGEMSVFSGGGKIHPALDKDPSDNDFTLLECLSADDDGTILKNYRERKTLVDVMRESGVKVE